MPALSAGHTRFGRRQAPRGEGWEEKQGDDHARAASEDAGGEESEEGRQAMRKPKAFDSWTKEDQESWLARFREKRREEARNRREDNPEKDRERCRKYREENTEKIRERDRARSKKYYWENREACRERVRKWVSEKRKEEGWTPKKVGRKPNPSPDPDSYYYKMKAIKSDPAKWADHLKAKEEKKARSKELRKAKHNERSKRRYRRIRESEGKIVGVPRKKMSDDERKAKNVQKNKLWKIRNPKKVAAQWERRRERERETGTGRENRKTPEYKK